MRGGRGGMRGGFGDRGGFGERGGFRGRGGRGGFGDRPPFYNNDRNREGGNFGGDRRGPRADNFRGGARKEEEGGEDRNEKIERSEPRPKLTENEGEASDSHNPNVVHME